MADIKDQMENWKEEHPEAEAATAAPDAPCFTCQRKAAQQLDQALGGLTADKIKSLLFQMSYDSLRREGGKIVLITDDECPPCDDASQIFEPLIREGAIEILPYSKCDPHDKECIAAQGIKTVPVLASRQPDGSINPKFYPLAGPNTSVSLLRNRLDIEHPGETMDEARQKAGIDA
jgi:hypothetical protein